MRVGNLVAGIILSCIGIIIAGIGLSQVAAITAYNAEMLGTPGWVDMSSSASEGYAVVALGVIFFLIPGIINVLVGAIMKPKPIIPKPQIPMQQQQQQQQVVIIPQAAPAYTPAPVPPPSPAPTAAPAETKFCSSCGQPIKKMAKFCDSCGAEQ